MALLDWLAAARPRRIAELERLHAAVRSPLALSTRVGFVGATGGAGCSVAAGLAACVLANRRSGRTLAVNASGGDRSILWHAGLTSDARTTKADDSDRASASSATQALAGLPSTDAGLYGIDLLQQPAADDTRWWEAVAPSSRFFDFVVTDWGVRDPDSLGHVAAASSLFAIVTTPDRVGVQRAVDIAAAAYAAGVPSLIAMMPTRGRPSPGMPAVRRALPVPCVQFPIERGHGAAEPQPSRALRVGTNLAALRLAAEIVTVAANRQKSTSDARKAAAQEQEVPA